MQTFFSASPPEDSAVPAPYTLEPPNGPNPRTQDTEALTFWR